MKEQPTSKEKQLNIRLTEQEKERIIARAKKCHYEDNTSAYVRQVSLYSAISFEDIEGKQAICNELNKIGININQCTKAINIIAKTSKQLNKNDIILLSQNLATIINLQKKIINLVDERLFVKKTMVK